MTVRIWDTEMGTPIASGSADKTVRLWDAASISPIVGPLMEHLDEVTCVAFSSDSRRVASGSSDRTDTETGMPVGSILAGNLEWIHSISFLPDGHRIASSSNDQTVRVWDLETGVKIGIPLTGHTNSVECVAVSPNGRLIASGSYDRTVRLWDAGSGASIRNPLVGHARSIASISFSSDGLRLVSGSRDGTIRLWDAQVVAQAARSSPDRETTSLDSPLVGDGGGGSNPANASTPQRSPSNIVSRLPRHINRLARYRQSDGWVCTERNELLFWLPPEYRRRRDDSVLVIASDPLLHTLLLDYSSFVHGANWTDVHLLQK
ncbi:hypothetical protein FRC10_007294 [Ceratobasidium sp. 414]|nr:hypothetical protein FRC10_007294 [Ceratobasidium sp. 414]